MEPSLALNLQFVPYGDTVALAHEITDIVFRKRLTTRNHPGSGLAHLTRDFTGTMGKGFTGLQSSKSISFVCFHAAFEEGSSVQSNAVSSTCCNTQVIIVV